MKTGSNVVSLFVVERRIKIIRSYGFSFFPKISRFGHEGKSLTKLCGGQIFVHYLCNFRDLERERDKRERVRTNLSGGQIDKRGFKDNFQKHVIRHQ